MRTGRGKPGRGPGGPSRPAPCGKGPSNTGEHLPAGLAVHLILVLPLLMGEEPVQAGAAVEPIDRVVVEDRRAVEDVGAVQAAAVPELADPRRVASVCRKIVCFQERHRVLATGDIVLSIQNGPVLRDPGRPISLKRLSGGSFSAPSAFAKALPPPITP